MMQVSLSRRSWCCHSRITRQPRDRSLRKFRWSRFRLVRSFSRQNGDSLCSQLGRRQPCQKSPSTNTATCCFMKTMSGLPGSDRTCRWKLRPRARSSRCTIFSIEPSLSFTRCMARERCSEVRWSGIEHERARFFPRVARCVKAFGSCRDNRRSFHGCA